MSRDTYTSKLILIFLILLLFSALKISAAEVSVSTEEEMPRVSIVLFETDLREALNEISLQTGVNIILDQTVSGVVTADLNDVPLEKALRIILIGGGYTYRKIDDFYFVGLPDPNNRTFSDLSETEVIRLNYIKGEEVFDVLPSHFEDYVEGDRASNTLTITAPPGELEKIKDIINEIDKPVKQIEVKVLVTEIDSEMVKELGLNLFEYNSEGKTNSFQFGLEENLLVLETDLYGKILTYLNTLEREQKAEINADPRIMVANGETAKLFIGDRQVLVINSDNEDYTSRIERIEVGVGIEVTAEILGENEILLQLAPEISHYVDNERPDIVVKQNSLSTTLRVKNGQTIALAGMTLKGDSFESQKVPVLSDIPIIRWLFRNDAEKKVNRELLVFVTPVIH
jgi:type IV pilus assembly protein PilQ